MAWIRTKKDGFINLENIENIMMESNNDTASGVLSYRILAFPIDHGTGAYRLAGNLTKIQGDIVMKNIHTALTKGEAVIDMRAIVDSAVGTNGSTAKINTKGAVLE